MNTSLSEFLQGYFEIPADLDVVLTGLTLDSRKVLPGNLFLAKNGSHDKGSRYIDDAIKKGAVAIIQEKDTYEFSVENDQEGRKIPIISIPHLSQKMGLLAARFFGEPSKDMFIVGITGTNGKTSCSQFIAAALEMAGIRCGVIGTLGNGMYGALKESALTTADPITLQSMLAQMRAQGAKCVAMEVSSHGLDQNRHLGVAFDAAIFTNLTQDHLDYHHTMEAYKQAKRKLFQVENLQHAIINIDDEFGRELVSELNGHVKLYGYSANGRLIESGIPQSWVQQVKMNFPGFTASVHTPWGIGVLHSGLMGRFNVSNLLAVLSILGIMGISLENTLEYLAKLRGVPGRVEVFGGNQAPYVVIDYAHTPDALSQVLVTLGEYCQGELWCVFGCGGDRDKGKRPMMGRTAEMYADHLVVTNDNPRYEDPQVIVAEILEGMLHPEAAVIEYDRQRAINHALSCAHAGDIVLVAGKGHEKYQQIGGVKHIFSDQLVVQMLLTQDFKNVNT